MRHAPGCSSRLRHLATGRTRRRGTWCASGQRCSGVLAGNFGNAFEAELVEQIEQAASERGFTILVCTTGRHPEDEANRIAALLEQPVAGIAMLQFSGDRGLMTQLLAERVPFVMVSCWDDHADCVAVDDYAGVELAVGHLADLGHRRIAYVDRRDGGEPHAASPAGGIRAGAAAPRGRVPSRLGDPWRRRRRRDASDR